MPQPNSFSHRIKTKIDGALRFPVSGKTRMGWSSCVGKPKMPIGLLLVILISGFGWERAGASPLSGMIPVSVLSLAAGNMANQGNGGTRSDLESLGKKSFRDTFKQRGVDLDNRVYQGSESVLPKPTLISHVPAAEGPQFTPKMWIAGEIALMIGTGFAGFEILSHTEKMSTASTY